MIVVARIIFLNCQTELHLQPTDNGFIQSEKLADLLQTLDLVYEPPE